MNRISELAGLLAGMTLFLGTLIIAQAYISQDAPDLRAELVSTMN
jgi:hypothetical protein